MLHKIFEDSKNLNKLIGIKLYGESGLWCGTIEDYNEEFIQLKHFTKNGELDGIAIEKIVDIERVDIDDDYLKAMEVVISNREKIKDVEIKSRMFDDLDSENWQFITLKPFEGDKDVIVSFQVNSDEYFRAFVISIDEEFIKVRIIDVNGNSDGISLFKLEDISSVKINDLECRRRALIYNSKN